MKKEERIKILTEKLESLKKYDLMHNGNVLGIDEAGRGPLAGPVVVAGVIMKKESYLVGVRDSKKITEKVRKELYDKILEDALYYDIQIVEPYDIDKYNILEATKKGAEKIIYNLKDKTDIILLDALKNLDTCDIESKSIIKGDDTSYAISCASILAKVTRDNLMEVYSEIYPEYNFLKNKGYGTKEHYEAIKNHGILDIHRKSFLKTLDKHIK